MRLFIGASAHPSQIGYAGDLLVGGFGADAWQRAVAGFESEFFCLALRGTRAKRGNRGSSAIEILLWLLFIIPGLCYTLWRMGRKDKSCRTCGSQLVIPLDSPAANQFRAQGIPMLLVAIAAPMVLISPTEAQAPGNAVNRAKSALLNQLFDPTSAQFQNVTFTRIGQAAIFCGQVNSRNHMGGYGGAQPFIIFGATVTINDGRPGTHRAFQRMEQMTCNGASQVALQSF